MADSFKFSRLKTIGFPLHNAKKKQKLKPTKMHSHLLQANTVKRIEALKQLAFKEGIFDFFLIFNSANLTYLSHFQGATALLIPKEGENNLYVSPVNFEQAKAETKV